MFDRAIIDTDRFMDLSMSSKALYFLLGMEADDEGFVSYKKVMRIHGGNEDDIKILRAKNFIIAFESGVVVITDWNKNNWLDIRRSKPTEYQKEKKQLLLTDNKEYVLSNGLASIEESRVEERSIAVVPTAPFVFKDYLKEMENHKARHINIIGMYLEEKGLSFDSREKTAIAIKRHLRSAQQLVPFTDKEIFKAVDTAKAQYKELWTIETLVKILTR